MRKLLLLLCVPLIFSCGENNDKENSLALYKKNLEVCKNYAKAQEEFDIETIDNLLTEDFEGYIYPANSPKGIMFNKNQIINDLLFQKEIGIATQFKHTVYLPGMDTVNLQMDGSVRVYFAFSSSLQGEEISLTCYQTIDFKDGKISRLDLFMDRSGVTNFVNSIFCVSEDCINGANDTINYINTDGELIKQYIGGFKNGKFHGEGTFTDNKDVYKGIFENGTFIGE